MQNRKAVIALLIVTGLIWSMIVYRIIKTLAGSHAPQVVDTYTVPSLPQIHATDTFSLIDDYRDPFLSYLDIPKHPINIIYPIKTLPPPPPPKRIVAFPNILYLGRVKNHDSQKHVAIMKIKNGIRNMSEGQTFNEVTLLKIMDDSVQVSFDNDKKMVPKSIKSIDSHEDARSKNFMKTDTVKTKK